MAGASGRRALRLLRSLVHAFCPAAPRHPASGGGTPGPPGRRRRLPAGPVGSQSHPALAAAAAPRDDGACPPATSDFFAGVRGPLARFNLVSRRRVSRVLCRVWMRLVPWFSASHRRGRGQLPRPSPCSLPATCSFRRTTCARVNLALPPEGFALASGSVCSSVTLQAWPVSSLASCPQGACRLPHLCPPCMFPWPPPRPSARRWATRALCALRRLAHASQACAFSSSQELHGLIVPIELRTFSAIIS